MKNSELSPSILNANWENLDQEIKIITDIGARYLHIDVMDGQFVPPKTFSHSKIREITKISNLINDVHIMINNPLQEAKKYINDGADILTFHLEACQNEEEVLDLIKLIKECHCKVGVSIKPKTDCKLLFNLLDKIDLVLVMSVEPGYGGQPFMLDSLDKVKMLRQEIVRQNLNTLIEIDGGINDKTIKLAKDAGVDIFVVGSYLFGHDDIKERYENLKCILDL